MRISDWSSDVCSSDLLGGHIAHRRLGLRFGATHDQAALARCLQPAAELAGDAEIVDRSAAHAIEYPRPFEAGLLDSQVHGAQRVGKRAREAQPLTVRIGALGHRADTNTSTALGGGTTPPVDKHRHNLVPR